MKAFHQLAMGAALALCLGAGAAQATTDLTGDLWSISAIDDWNINWAGSTLEFTSQVSIGGGDFSVGGYFDWVADNGAYGTEFFSGTYFSDDTFSVTGTTIVNNYGLVLATYNGVVSADGNTISGDWDDGIPGDFTAVRNVSPVPIPAGLPLVLSGLGALAFVRRRRLAKT